MGRWENLSWSSFLVVLLHETVNFEPVRSASITTSRFGHTHTEAFLEPTGLAGCPVSFVDDTNIVILAIRNHCLIVAKSSEETFTSFASESAKMKSSSFFVANSTLLILKTINIIRH